jgi:UDPglucose 6-dehydrogenase
MHDTEVDDDDNVNLETFFEDVNSLQFLINKEVRVLVTSQVPPGTCEKVLLGFREQLKFEPLLGYMPENLRLGNAIARFQNPELPVIGLNQGERIEDFSYLFPRVLFFESCTLTEAEMLKSSLNVFLAISITFGNEISEICDQFGADGSRVMRLLKMEPRINRNLPILPGMPFSGGTLGRDVQNLQRISTSNDGGLIKSIWDSNHHRGNYLIDTIRDICKKNSLKRVGLLGLTYKPETSTLRRSFPLEVFSGIHSVLEVVSGYDPMSSHFKDELPNGLLLLEEMREVFEQSELLVITTPWSEILEFLISTGMRDKYLVDPYGVLRKNFANEPNYYQFGGLRRNS